MVQAAHGGLSVLVAAVFLACAPERQAPGSGQPDTATATKALGTLEVRLSVPARVAQGSPVPITVDVVNRGDTAAADFLAGRDGIPAVRRHCRRGVRRYGMARAAARRRAGGKRADQSADRARRDATLRARAGSKSIRGGAE